MNSADSQDKAASNKQTGKAFVTLAKKPVGINTYYSAFPSFGFLESEEKLLIMAQALNTWPRESVR